MLFRRLKMFIIGLVSVMAVGSLAAFSYFSFDKMFDQIEINSNHGLDNIKENYSFGAKDPDYNKYEIYFFPSTAYADASIMGNTYINEPEKMFGYIEPVLNDKQEPVYDTNNNLTFNRYEYNSVNNQFELNNLGNFDAGYISKITPTNNQNKFYLAEMNYCKTVYAYGDRNDSYEKFIGGKDIENSEIYRNIYKVDEGFTQAEQDKKVYADWQYMGRTHRTNDRFGFWTQITEGKGRFLPEKLTVNGALPVSMYEQLTTKPFTSMGDLYHYFNFTFTHWAYKKSTNNPRPYTNFKDGFACEDVSKATLFDIMNNLSRYADENNVIRLYPAFSNGKNYENNAPDYKGKRDSAKVNYFYKDPAAAKLNLRPPETYFTYVADDPINTANISNKNKTIKYLVVKNVLLVPNLYKEIQIRVAYTAKKNFWPNGWNCVFDYSEAEINSIINAYGTGLYNLYLFLGNTLEPDLPNGLGKSFESKPEWLKNPLPNMDTLAVDPQNGFKTLFNKKLIPFNDKKGKNTEYADLTARHIWIGKDYWHSEAYYYQNRPANICLEKITELKVYKEIHLGSPQFNMNDEAFETKSSFAQIDEEIAYNRSSALNFVNASDVYYGTPDSTALNFTPASTETIESGNPYVYFIRNVDFTDVNSLFFTIRLTDAYVNIDFNSPPETGQDLVGVKTMTDGVEKYQVFQNAYTASGDERFFDILQIKEIDKPDKRNVFRLLDDECKGIYDFILIKVPGQDKFTMYVYRHMNIFVKVFSQSVGIKSDTLQDKDGNNIKDPITGEDVIYQFADHDHKLQNGDPDPSKEQPIWESNFYIGKSLTGSYKSSYTQYKTFEETIGEYMVSKGWTTATLFDHVTLMPICYFTLSGNKAVVHTHGASGSDAKIFTILKNYILYIREGIHMTAESSALTQG